MKASACMSIDRLKKIFAQNKTGQYPLRSIILGNVDGVNNGSLDMAPDLSSHRYSIQWTGDTETFERTLEQEIAVMVLEGALYVTPYVSDDIGGHRGALPDSNLYARWVQYAALSPIMRFHSGSSRYPWDYPEVEDTVRDYVQLRYRLTPLFYALAQENYETGLPLCRRLDFNYPQYGEAQDNTQYLIGDDILVAPLYTAAGSDADGDEAFTTADVVLFMQYLNGHSVEINLNNADFNQDGRISIADAVLLLRRLSV